jgi:histidine triad (HIT) family protein
MEEQQCIFCKIVNREVQAFRIFEDERLLGVLDINPLTKGHMLLFPKQHFQLLTEMPEELIAHLGQVSKWIANSLQKLFSASGASIITAAGGAAGQTAPHVIFHIIPRYDNDGAGLFVQRKQVPREQLEKLKAALLPKLKAELGYGGNAKAPPELEGDSAQAPSKNQEPRPEEAEQQTPEAPEAPEAPDSGLDSVTSFLAGGGK